MMKYVVWRHFLCALVLALLPLGAWAQSAAQQIQEADWFERPLGKGVVWKYYYFDDLFNGPQNISILEADLDDADVSLELPYRFGSFEKTSTMIKSFANAAGGVNGTFYSNNNGVRSHRGYVRVNGTEITPSDGWSNWGYQGGLVFNRNTGAASVRTRPRNTGGAAGAPADWRTTANNFTDAIVGGPILVRNGAKATSQYENIGTHCNARHPRTMVGMLSDNRLVLVTGDGRHPGKSVGFTCEEMAQVMDALGCITAFSLDGGGSTSMYGRGQANNGILNHPSDRGIWPHDFNGERVVANAIAVIAPPAIPPAFDATVQIVSVPSNLGKGETGQVTLRLTNIGSQAWNNKRISIKTARPAQHAGRFYAASTWLDEATAWQLPEGVTVSRGQQILVNFEISGPSLPGPGRVTEFYQLMVDDATRFGPGDEQIPVSVLVAGDSSNIIVEPRSGGQNPVWYSELGVMADTPASASVPGATPDLGSRYGSTYRSVAGAKTSRWLPEFPQAGFYRVHVAWPAGNLRRSPITYKIHHSGGTATFEIDQTVNANQWVALDTQAFEFDAGIGSGQGVEMSNEGIDASGSMYAGPVWFEWVGNSNVENWELY